MTKTPPPPPLLLPRLNRRHRDHCGTAYAVRWTAGRLWLCREDPAGGAPFVYDDHQAFLRHFTPDEP